MTLARFLVVGVMVAAGAVPAAGQVVPGGEMVDRVVAIVGDSAILFSQLEEEKELRRLQGVPIPTDPAGQQAMYEDLLEDWVSRLLVLLSASNDSLIQVDDERVESAVSQSIDERIRAYGGQAGYQQALQREGLTQAQYRDLLTTQVRQEQTQQLFMQRRLQSAPTPEVTEEELRAMFEQAREQIGQRPRVITFEQVVVAPAPSEVVLEAARAEAAALLVRIRAGEDFAELAKQYSADVGSAELGGDLGWFRRGSMVQEFEDAAFGLIDGQVSEPIKSVYGYHLIKVERSRSGERRGRHILIQPETDPQDLLRGRARADTVVTLARAGTPMSDLYARYSDDEAPDSLTVPYAQLDSLPPGYSQLSTAAVGDVVGPLEYEPAPGQARFAIVRVRAIREAGEFTFEDLRGQLTQQLERTKQIQRILDSLKAGTHVEIRLQQQE